MIVFVVMLGIIISSKGYPGSMFRPNGGVSVPPRTSASFGGASGAQDSSGMGLTSGVRTNVVLPIIKNGVVAGANIGSGRAHQRAESISSTSIIDTGILKGMVDPGHINKIEGWIGIADFDLNSTNIVDATRFVGHEIGTVELVSIVTRICESRIVVEYGLMTVENNV